MKSQATPNTVLIQREQERKENRLVIASLTLMLLHDPIAEGVLAIFSIVGSFPGLF